MARKNLPALGMTRWVESADQQENISNFSLPQSERIVSSSSGWFDFSDVYALNFYHLGKIYGQKGWKGKAIEHYEKFLSLWKNANLGIPEADNARIRLAGIR